MLNLLLSPIVIDEMRAKHHDFKFKLIGMGFDPEHDRSQLGVVCSVACRHTHSQSPLTLQQWPSETHMIHTDHFVHLIVIETHRSSSVQQYLL